MTIRIIKSTDTAAVDALLSPRRDDDAATRKAVAAIVEAVRKGGDEAVARFARKFDGLDGPAEIPRDQWTRGARQAPREVRRAIADRRPEHRARGPRAGAATVSRPGRAWGHRRAARSPARPRGLLRAGWPVSAALVAPDDGHSRACGRSRRDHRRLSASGAGGAGSGRGRRRHATVSARRRARHRGPGLWHPDDPASGPHRRTRQQIRRRRQDLCLRGMRHRHAGRAQRDPRALGSREPDVARRRPDRAGRARPRRPRDSDHVEGTPGRGGCARGRRVRCPPAARAARRWRVTAASSSRARLPRPCRWPTGWRPSTWSSTTSATAAAVARAGAIFIGPHTAQVAGDYAIGSNHVLPTGGAARLRGGLHAADYVRVVSVQRVTAAGLKALGPTVRALALAEGLTAHAQSMIVRGV